MRDITARKQAEEALRQMNDVLEQRVEERTAALTAANSDLAKATRLKDEFLASMSHELRTPLNAILGLSEALQEHVYGPLTDKQGQTLHRIEESGRHLLALITDILDLSKIEAGKVELQVTPIDVEGVCQASLRLIRDSAHTKHLTITSTVDSAVTTLLADERRLKQMLVNLLSNAVKFTPAAGRIGLHVTGHPAEQVVSFTVWDTGIGIADADRARLFQPFVQLDSSLARHHAGTGLGLSLVSRLAALHGGRITLESTVGQGSRFRLELPWRVATPGRAPAPQEEHGAWPLAGLERVMVVEDTPAHAEQVVRYLHELAVHVIVYPQSAGVVDYARTTQPEVILLDLALPDGSGWDVLAQLKAESCTREIPVVIVSVLDEQAQGLAQGAAAYLVKPVSREQLQTTVRQVRAHQRRGAPAEGVPRQHVMPGGGPLLLLADDNAINVTTVGDYLRAKGYRVTVAGTGADALAQASALHPSLILMDIQMPGMDGLEATRRLRAEPDPHVAATPIIALTALAMPGDRERCLDAGVNAYVTKPVRLHDLLQIIATQLQGEPACTRSPRS
jgi:signal transduction histidine kinase/DNA-binding response OmpR family regulator